ncbi:MAG TPA: cupin domain-containing protein [Pyrinomonadaceae bacterium]|nr:cupin domain-containing protein [Pyrinomonadaceae bacterium]
MKHSVADDELRAQLALYALGALSQQEARVVEHHLAEGCEVCAAQLQPFESVVEALGFAVLPATPPAGVRAKLISRLAEETQAVSPPLHEAIKKYSLRANEGHWKETAPGLFEKHLFTDERRGTVTTLIKMLPGIKLPSHRHVGLEECLVIKGDFHVGGEEFGPGDYRCSMAGTIDETPFSMNGALLLIVSQGSHGPVTLDT